MAAITNELHGINGFWRQATATGAIVNAKTGFYPVIEGCIICAVGGAAAGSVAINSTTTTSVVGARLTVGTTATGAIAPCNMRVAMADGEGLSISTGGTAPTSFSVIVWGRFLPTNTPISDNKSGVLA